MKTRIFKYSSKYEKTRIAEKTKLYESLAFTDRAARFCLN